ncbi:hypothetical protein RB653_007285 [Dictyostelium firmibasis]|uniref:ATP-dependent protease subunit HslV n=1 Tax=Dictyostelium firmibasis TaxID=79012 RepID=A0AAN7TND7_9MYCE
MSKFSKLSSKYIIPSLQSNTIIGNLGQNSASISNVVVESSKLSSGSSGYYTGGHYGGAPPPQYWGLGAGAGSMHSDPYRMKATTILSVRRNGKVVIIGDGQVTLGHSIVKPNAKKIRKLADGKIIAGFAGSVADAFTLFELLERKLTEHRGLLLKSCVELAQQWRTDKYYRRLEASLIVADKDITLNIDGNGDVLEPNDGILAIGSGGDFALSAARALLTVPDLDPEEIARRSMKIAADICIYTNHNFILEVIDNNETSTAENKDSNINPIIGGETTNDSNNTTNTNSITDSITSSTLSTTSFPDQTQQQQQQQQQNPTTTTTNPITNETESSNPNQ